MQGIRLIFIDLLTVDLGAVRATLIPERVVAIALADDRGVQARDSQIFQEDVAFTAATDAASLFAHLLDATGLFPLLDADHTHASSSHTTHSHASSTATRPASEHCAIAIRAALK